MKENDIETYKTFGLILKYLRKSKGKTQMEMAKDLGFTQASIYRYEKGLVQISVSTLQILAKYFEMSVTELIDLDYDEKSKTIISHEEELEDSDLFYDENPARKTKRVKQWNEEVEEFHFTDEEFNMLVEYAKFIISRRKK